MLSEQAQAVIARLTTDDISHVDLQFTDVTGMVKTMQIPARVVESALSQGVWFDGSALEGFARIAERDMYLRPDLTTYAILPFEQDRHRVARLICDVYMPTGEPFSGDPRAVLKQARDLAAQLNYRYVVAPELEFFLFRQPLNAQQPQAIDDFSYFDVSDTLSRQIRREICDVLEQMGIQVDSAHHETGAGQHEIDFAPLEALTAADAVMTARFAIKSIAAAHNLYATFMPKPLAHVAGSGLHVHQVLVDTFTQANVFAAPESGEYQLSAVGRSFIAGQLAHARAMCAVLAPLVNSYKRLVAGLEAPVYITWAQNNRAALLRVPRIREARMEEVRVELRCVDPSCNPYLAFAVMLRAGVDGITKQMEAPNPAEENLYLFDARRRGMITLPTSLNEALDAMESSELIHEALGANAYDRFVGAKRLEWDDYVRSVSPWELDRYLRIY